MKNIFFNFNRLAFKIHGNDNFRVSFTAVALTQRSILCFLCTYVQQLLNFTAVAQTLRSIFCFLCSYAQEQLFPCFDKETQTTAFIYCYIDTVVGLSIVKFHIFAVKRKQLELWKALTIL